MSRASKITRVSEEGTEKAKTPSWMKDVAESVHTGKTIVQITRERQKAISSYLNSLQTILTNRSRYATVEDAVQDMRERTGLNTYLQRISNKNYDSLVKKIAEVSDEISVTEETSPTQIPDVLKEYNEDDKIVTYIENKLRGLSGNASVIQLQSELDMFHVPLEVQNSHEVMEWLSAMIAEAKGNYPSKRELIRPTTPDDFSDSGAASDHFQNMVPNRK